MVNNSKPPQKITIGTKASDTQLISDILAYRKEKNLKSAAEAVRALCRDALAIKKAIK